MHGNTGYLGFLNINRECFVAVLIIACRELQFDTYSVDSQTCFTTAVEFSLAGRSEYQFAFFYLSENRNF
jgi:hypothetical protein